MEAVLRLNINAFALLIAAILYLGSRSRNDRRFADYRLFSWMIVVTMLEIVLDCITWISDGRPGAAWRVAVLGSNALYFILHPVVPMLYGYYAICQCRDGLRQARRWLGYLCVPAILSGLIALTSPITGLFFSADGSNVYSRGPLFPLFAAFTCLYAVFALAYVLARRGEMTRKTALSLLLFPLPPAIGGVVQGFCYGIVVTWPAMVLSLLVIFLNVQQRKLSLDYLTGANNRRRLDEYLDGRIEEARERGRGFGGFLADVDDFKLINDRLGHAAGDSALVEVVRLMQSCLRSGDFLARYAGDEFVAILPLAGEEELEGVVRRIREYFEEACASRAYSFRLSLSIGTALFDPRIDANADAYLRRLDGLMYLEKEGKKSSALRPGADAPSASRRSEP
jgi:diguanylate cyclase (GGDEF) domain